jgi:4-amino-4-deoxy-L-arabinose transferase-like glycosyltransferase
MAPVMGDDSSGYLAAAHDLAAGGQVKPPAAHSTATNGLPDAGRLRTPGYPLLLLAVGASERPTRFLFLVQLLLQVASVCLACAALRSAGAGTALTVIVGLIGLLPPFVLRSAYILTETLAQFCVVLAVASLQRFLDRGGLGWLSLSSLAVGYAALTRPTFALAAVVLGLLLVLLGARTGTLSFSWRQALLLMAGTFVFVGGYAVFNQVRFGVTASTGTLGYNLADLCPSLYGEIPDPTTKRLLVQERNDAYVSGRPVESAHFRAYGRLMEELHLKSEELEPWLRAQLTRAILGHPVQYLQAVVISVGRFWFPASADLPLLREKRYQLFWYPLHFFLVGTLVVEAFVFATWFLLAAYGVRFNEAINRAWVLWFACMVVVWYNAAVSCAIEIGQVRYRSATEMLLLVAAGAGLVGSQRLFRTLPLLRLSTRG